MIDELSTRKLFSRLLPTLCCLFIAGLCWPSPAEAKEIPFAAAQTIGTLFDGALSVDIGDIDGDGDLDVVAAAAVDGEISWWENSDGDGSLWTERLVTDAFPQVQSVRLTDLEDDGDLDILATSSGDDIVRYWRNLGAGGSWGPFDIETGSSDPVFAIGADIDRDSSDDVVTASAAGITWWFNRFSTGVFFQPTVIEATSDLPSSLAAADVDGDGDPDVLATLAGSNEVVWYENTAGNGSAWTRRSVAVTFDGAASVVASDLDGDGDIDVVAAARDDDSVAWWENTSGDGSAWGEHVVDAAFQDASSVEALDLDGDGDLDILGAASALGEVQWWENTVGDASLWTARPLAGPLSGAAAAAGGDFDGDGDLDVVAAASGSVAIAWWENESIHRNAAYPRQRTITTSLDLPQSIHSADIDGDGDEDLIGADATAGDVLWWENSAGDGSTWIERVVDADFAGANGVYAADVDRDGDIDIGGTSGSQGTVVWWRNESGDGSTWTRLTIAALPQASVPQLVDIDDDDDLDMVAVSPLFFRIVSWINLDGLGTSWFQRIVQGNFPGASSQHTIDFDGDDRPDLATTATTFNAVAFVRNPVTGFQAAIIDNDFPGASSAFGADLDGDGDNDLLAASRSAGEIVWYENTTGTGVFAARQVIAAGFADVTLARAADLDGDGDIDVYATSGSGHLVAWWENIGDASSWSARDSEGPFGGAAWVHATNIDGDGQPDLAAAGTDGGVSWWRNEGGEFALPTTDTTPPLVVEGAATEVLRIDAAHRGRAGDSAIELVTVELLLESAPGTPASDAEAASLLTKLSLYADDGSGQFEEGADTEVVVLETFTLQDGVATLPIADGLSAAQLAATIQRSFFVVPTFDPAASNAMLGDFRIIHLTESSSAGEDAANDLPLTLELSPNISSSAFVFNTAPVAQDDAVTTPEDQTVGGNVLDGTSGGLDSDNEGTQLSAVLESPPSHGTLIGGLASDGGFLYAPNLNFNGLDTFTYRANDGLSSSGLATVTVTVSAVNDAPSFTLAAEHASAEDAGPQTVPAFATAILPGPSDESVQTVSFQVVTVSNPGLFQAPPTLAPDGALTYEGGGDANGSATVTLRLMDDGGTADGGVDQSAEQSFEIVISAVNDAPSFTLPTSEAHSLEDAGIQDLPGIATGIAAGPGDETGQVLTFNVLSNDNPGLFTQAPSLSADGTLTFETAPNANGTANLSIELTDDGGTTGGGVDTSPAQSLAVVVGSVNDPPSFTLAAPLHDSFEDAGAQSVPGFAGNLSPGPANEAGQSLSFTVTTNSNPALFAVQPLLSIDGTLSYKATDDAVGTATIGVILGDDGGTATGGVDQSLEQSFEIVISAVNDPPSFTLQAEAISNEDGGPQLIAAFASSISAGPDDEAGQSVTFSVDSVTDPGLFSSGPMITSDGILTYTGAPDANGLTTVTVILSDDGGVENGGLDQSAPQSFEIRIEAVNDAPSFTVPKSTVVDAGAAPQSLAAFSTGISPGPVDEVGQGLGFEITANSAPQLFAEAPTLSTSGELSFRLVPGLSDVSAEISLLLRDDGGTALGGVDTSPLQTFELVIPDVDRPQIVSAGALPGGEIAACGEFRQRFGSLIVTFSEPMADGGAGSALNPANYQIVRSGPDQDIQTVACDTALGDDQILQAAAVMASSVDDPTGASTEEVTVELPGLLADGPYKLLICETLEDLSGNSLASTFDAAFRVSSSNLFANGDVDCDLEPWITVSDGDVDFAPGGGGEFSYSTEDVDGSSLSGSMAVTPVGGSRFAIGQCLDLPSTVYDLAARVRIEGIAGVEVAAELRCELFAQPGCVGASAGASVDMSVLEPIAGEWQRLEFAAGGGESAICGLDLELVAGPTFEAFIDGLEASTSLLVDGFESGDTAAWSLTQP